MHVFRILLLLKIPRITHCYSPSSLQLQRGRKIPSITTRFTSSGISGVTEPQLLEEITDLLSKEFVYYGYKKITKHLQKSGYRINGKKVFRILRENNLLNHRYNYRSPAREWVESAVSVRGPN
jgi:hypothetical protein